MRAHLIALAAFATISGPALAEPVKHDAPKPGVAKEQERPVNVVLASAEPGHTSPPIGAQTSTPAAKRPLPRVTTCRCGDQEVDPDTQDQ